MKVTITFDTNGAAFCEDPDHELTFVLRQAGNALSTEPCGPNGFRKTLLDSNGNARGYVVVSDV